VLLVARAEAADVRRGPGFPSDPKLRHNQDFKPSGKLTRLSQTLWRFEDTCNVYVVRDGSRAILIDFGSGAILGRLSELGIRTVDMVLVTHHHRDQAQGLCDLRKPPFEIIVPAKERRFFDGVESFWRDVKLYINYDCRSHFNTLRRSIRVDRVIAGGERINWNGIELEAEETPGVTEGSLSYIATIDGKKVGFTGDLLAGAGKVQNWFDLHWDYYGFTQGIDASEQSFQRLQAAQPDLLLPSHGDPIGEPAVAMAANRKVYAELCLTTSITWTAGSSPAPGACSTTCRTWSVRRTPRSIPRRARTWSSFSTGRCGCAR